MNLLDEFRAIVRAMQHAGIPYAVCGGIAVTIHGFPRTTRDIDLLIQPDDLDRTLDCVRPLGYVLEGGLIPLGFGEPHERNVYRISKASGTELMTLDLVLVNPLLAEAWNTREEFTMTGETFIVVSPAGLAIMKRLSGRRQDLVDLEQLGLMSDDHPTNPSC